MKLFHSSSSSSSWGVVWTASAAYYLAVMFVLPEVVKGEYGDTVDPTFNCPALTTCPQVCVATVDDCPIEMSCPNDGEMLCADGSCAIFCDPDLENPCPFECAPVACNRIDATYDVCQSSYGPLYENETACGEIEWDLEVNLLTFTEPAYIVGYVWVSGVTFLVLVWCAFNQRLAPVAGSTKILQIDSKVTNSDTDTTCTQTGYKTHPIGMVLHFLTVITFWGYSACLIFLTIQYYVWNEQHQVAGRTLHFEDEQQLLKTWIIVWGVGFAWCFALKWPYSIGSLFLRRCPLQDATHVAVFLRDPTIASSNNKRDDTAVSNNCVAKTMRVFEIVFGWINVVMAALFSDVDASLRTQGIYQYCKVKIDPTDGSRSFTFLLRRYNLVPENQKGDDDSKRTTSDKEDEEVPDSKSSSTDDDLQNVEKVFSPGSWTVGKTLGDLHSRGDTKVGLAASEVQDRYRVIGMNTIEMDRPSWFREVGKEFSKPFYTYQLYLVWSWFPLYYFYMAMIIGFTVTLSAVTVASFHYRNLRNLYKITHIEGQAEVLRDGQWVVVDQTELVPGDIIKVAPGVTYCDMVLVSGDNTLLDESAITGEASPMVKTPIDPTDADNMYDAKTHKRHTISAGTTVLEAEDSIAVVMKTASYTVKGELLRDIFGYKRHSFKFDKEVYVVMGILVLYAIVGFVISIELIDDTAVVGFFYGIYVVASAIPPLLPTTFTVSVGVSDVRLANKRVACSNSESILIAGKVKKAFFDKTGTLTKQGLDFKSGRSTSDWTSMSLSNELSVAMACCHSLARSKGGDIIGNPVDVTMFNASRGQFEGEGVASSITDGEGKQHEVVRHFDFDHQRMTQSVIVKLQTGEYVAFVKGSGESISKLCNSSSLPSDFHGSMRESALAGTYQISVASKPIDVGSVNTITRDEVECDCSFVGVLNFLNTIREETPDVIRQLSEGCVDSVVVTGDNVLTGIRIAREAGIVSRNKPTIVGNVTEGSEEIVWTEESGVETDMPTKEQLEGGHVEVALSGSAWVALRKADPKHALYMAPFVRVFGRCTPHDKVSVVDTFVELGFISLFCGDGANDCGALKAAHVGVALSDAEASIVSPFTSLDRSISSVVEVLREGRCALASAFAVYKYIIMYGQITTMNQIMNNYFQITFAEWNWVWIDGVWPICLSYTLPLARAAKSLSQTRPTSSLLGAQTVSSVVGMIVFHFLFTVLGLGLLFQQDWFQCRMWEATDMLNALVIGDNYESQVIFLITGAQYISTAIALNFGYEFRQNWFFNYIFVALVAGFSIIHLFIIFVPSKLSCFFRVNCENENVVLGVTGGGAVIPIQNFFNTTMMPDDFQWMMFAIIIANSVTICVYEVFIVNGIRRRSAAKKLALVDNEEGVNEQAEEDHDA